MLFSDTAYIFHGEYTTLRINSSNIADNKDILNLFYSVSQFYRLHNISCFSYTDKKLRQPCPTILTTCTQEWQDYYKTHRVYLIDPAIYLSFNRLIPTDWLDLDQNLPISQEFFELVHRFDIGDFGLNIPIQGPNNKKSVVAITAKGCKSDWLALKQKYLRDLIIIAQVIHNTVHRFFSEKTEIDEPSLSRREKQCLYWASRGKTVQETALILGISYNTVRAYIESARHSLDAYTIAQAVTKAIYLNLLLPDPENC